MDATLGRAGHAGALLAQHPGLEVVGVDADDAAIEESGRLLAPYQDRVTLVHAAFDQIPEILARLDQLSVQGVLFDLGVSSPQLDDPARGFAYSYDAPLDMRMDRTQVLTAADIVNTYPAARLAQVLRDYGEERFARRIADAVVRDRSRAPFTSTMRLSEIVRDSIPAPARRAAAIRPNARSRHSGSRLTASSTRCAGPCPRRSARSRWAAGLWSLRITRWKTAQ